MEENTNDKQKATRNVIIVAVVIAVTAVLLIIKFTGNKNPKSLSGKEFLLEEETDYSEYDNFTNLPTINMKGKEIKEINDAIIKAYYRAAVDPEFNSFNYTSDKYKDVLSIAVEQVLADNSEYGKITYLVYNIDTKTGKVLNNEELYKKLKIDGNEVASRIDKRFKSLYDQDKTKGKMTFQQYKDYLTFDKDFKIAISEKKLYYYKVINYTQYLATEYKGNLYNFKIMDLD